MCVVPWGHKVLSIMSYKELGSFKAGTCSCVPAFALCSSDVLVRTVLVTIVAQLFPRHPSTLPEVVIGFGRHTS